MEELQFDQDIIDRARNFIMFCRERGLLLEQSLLLIKRMWGSGSDCRRRKLFLYGHLMKGKEINCGSSSLHRDTDL